MTWRHSGDRLSGFVIKKYRRRNSGEWTEAEEEIETERTARRKRHTPRRNRKYKFCIRATGPSGNSGAICKRIDLSEKTASIQRSRAFVKKGFSFGFAEFSKNSSCSLVDLRKIPSTTRLSWVASLRLQMTLMPCLMQKDDKRPTSK